MTTGRDLGEKMLAIEELYMQEIRQLPAADRLQLLALIGRDLASTQSTPVRRVTELRGLGKEIWQDVDAQHYVDELRSDWDRGI